MTLKVGITGGIGSGKSTVSGILEHLGVPVYNSDSRARWIQENDPAIVARITQLLGSAAYTESRKLNTAYVSRMVFGDSALLQGLNRIVHPAVAKDFGQWAAEWEQAGAPYIVQEAAILIESGMHKDLDRIIVVTAPVDLRIERVARRDGRTAGEVLRLVESQMGDEQRAAHADYIITADDEHLLTPQVTAIHEKLMAEAARLK